jgi:hypothetical protein
MLLGRGLGRHQYRFDGSLPSNVKEIDSQISTECKTGHFIGKILNPVDIGLVKLLNAVPWRILIEIKSMKMLITSGIGRKASHKSL